jgi:hypothetical protein
LEEGEVGSGYRGFKSQGRRGGRRYQLQLRLGAVCDGGCPDGFSAPWAICDLRICGIYLLVFFNFRFAFVFSFRSLLMLQKITYQE